MPEPPGGADPGKTAPPNPDADAPVEEPPDAADGERAAQLLRDAEAVAAERGREMVNQAREVRRRMLDDVEHRRRALLDELNQVRARLDELTAGLAETLGGDDLPDAEPPAAEPTPAPPAAAGRPSAHGIFARLREAEERDAAAEPEPAAPLPGADRADGRTEAEPTDTEPTDTEPTDTEPTDTEPEPPADAVVDTAGDADAATRRGRDEVLAPLSVPLLRTSKRLLQDEQNDILDRIRKLRGRVDAARLLPDVEEQRTAWKTVLAPSIDGAYTAGGVLTAPGRRSKSAPPRLAADLAAELISPLRERLTSSSDAVLADGPYESGAELHAALTPAISARYREWRALDLEGLLGDLLAVAYARGVYDAARAGTTLRWVPAEIGRCPDADDNALEPTVKGQPFPTGQPYPPAHPGCRCLVVPVPEDSTPGPT